MSTAPVSSRNPFRKLRQTTPASEVSSMAASTVAASPPVASEPAREQITADETARHREEDRPLPPVSEREPESVVEPESEPPAIPPRLRRLSPEPAEEPPAYTPSPDVTQGESTLEYGPRRPFQQPPRQPAAPPPSQSHIHSQSHFPSRPMTVTQQRTHPPSLWKQLSQITDQIASQLAGPTSAFGTTTWSSYPGRVQQPIYTGRPAIAYPPRNPLLRVPPALPPRPSSGQGSASIVSPESSMSEFARDFYAAGTGQSTSEPHLPSNTDTTQYAPPPGPPPSQISDPPDDNRPTTTPTPGRPLLRDGKLLVYPKGFECEKCHNIGYKHADPTHPCKKCWSRYGRTFTGPLAYSYGPTDSSSSTPRPSNLQRPLPNFRPPRHSTSAAPSHLHTHRGPAASVGSWSSPHQPSQVNPTPQPPSHVSTLSPYAVPPRNAVVYPSGDPMLGGTLCWRCEGRGTVSLLVFDTATCAVCGGVGRLFS